MIPVHAKPAGQARAHHLSLNSDGQRHTLLNAATFFTLVVGIAAFALGMIPQHLPATILGIAGFIVGMSAQMMSATRAERIFIVPGIIFSFVGMALGLAHGGFS